jgi:hypothetical protein
VSTGVRPVVRFAALRSGGIFGRKFQASDKVDKLQYFSNNIFGDNFDELNEYFKATNAYKEPSEGKLNVIERSMPDINLAEI